MATNKRKLYMERRERLRTRSTMETATDQSEASNTDINVVIGYMLKTGQPPGDAKPMYGDFTELPTDLRGFIEMARSMNRHRNRLPEKLRNMSVADLTALTREQLGEILKPPATPATPATPADDQGGKK